MVYKVHRRTSETSPTLLRSTQPTQLNQLLLYYHNVFFHPRRRRHPLQPDQPRRRWTQGAESVFFTFESVADVEHQANLSNENTSEESKQHSRAQLDELESSGRLGEHSAEKNTNNVLGGYKATINSQPMSFVLLLCSYSLSI